MATNTYVDLNIPEVRDLADLTGIEHDLKSARGFAHYLLSDYQRGSWDLSDPLTTAILVRYARSFVTGVRGRLRDDALAVLSPAQQERHRYFCDLRDKYAAHSVNAFEESQPVARFWKERVAEEGIEQISCMHSRVVGLSNYNLEEIIGLTTRLLEYVERRIQEERARLLVIVRSMPLESVIGCGNPGPMGGELDPRKPRRQF